VVAPDQLVLRAYQPADEAAVVALWRACDLVRPWNDPHKDIARKLLVQPELFLVAESAAGVVGTAMAGYDGHRGWLYYLAVAPSAQRLALGRRLVSEVERLLLAMGCPKINLQVRSTNTGVIAFYEKLGFTADASASLGKRLIPDLAPTESELRNG
jgi:ribosomal protein S18 acetylase RimI-like enzyme